MQQPYSSGNSPVQPANVTPSAARSLAWIRQIPTTMVRKVPQSDKPGPMAYVRLTMTILFMLFVAWAAYLIGMWPISIVFVIACITGFVGARNVGKRFTQEGFAHFNGWDEAPGDVAGVQSVKAPGDTNSNEDTGSAEKALDPSDISTLGLLNPEDPTVRMMSAPLKKSLRHSIAEARAKEAEVTSQWLLGTPGFTPVHTTSGDGTPLVGHMLVASPANTRWIVIAHDYHGSWTDGLLYARHYAEHRYNLLLLEMRGHGESGGKWIGMGYLDSLDLLAWCQWICARQGDQARIALHGCGMGAAAAILCAGETALPSQVHAVVCENVFTDAWNAIVSLYHGLGLDVHPGLDLVRSNLRHQHGGYDLSLAAPIDYLDDVSVPVLFTHAAHDTFIPPYMSVQMYRAAVEKHPEAGHEIASFDHAGHQMSCLGDEQSFYSTVFAFLDSKL